MKKKIALVILIFVFLYATGGVYYNVYFKEEPKNAIKNVDAIDSFGYTLKSNSTLAFKTEFNNLKKILKTDPINDEEYAKSISKLFIIDLYTISNKINKYDVGGLDYVYPDALDNYKLNVEDTIYKYVEDNSKKDRAQELPEVSTITIKSIEPTNYKIAEKDYDAYKVTANWTYTKDMGYDTEGSIILIKIDKKYYVVEKD